MARGIWFVSHVFGRCASQTTHGQARLRIARDSRAILAWLCVLFSLGRVLFDSRNVQKRGTKSDISGHCGTAYLSVHWRVQCHAKWRRRGRAIKHSSGIKPKSPNSQRLTWTTKPLVRINNLKKTVILYCILQYSVTWTRPAAHVEINHSGCSIYQYWCPFVRIFPPEEPNNSSSVHIFMICAAKIGLFALQHIWTVKLK